MKLTDLTNNLLRGANSRENGDDLGFGTKITAPSERLINADGSFNIRRTGIRGWAPYQWLVEMPWGQFFLLVFVFYGLTNAFFAGLFVLAGLEHVQGVAQGSVANDFIQAFFFSVQTFTTVGYGAMSPIGIAANLIASIDALVGLMTFAIATGLFFARFAKPKAQILFSRQGIVGPYKDSGLNSFQFRIANRRRNKVINLSAFVTMSWVENQSDQKVRRFQSLPLERQSVVMFPLNWTIVHIIDSESPLRGLTPGELEARNAEFIIFIEGFDETYSQQIHATRSYTWKELQWGVRFAPMYHHEPGYTVLELDKINQILPEG